MLGILFINKLVSNYLTKAVTIKISASSWFIKKHLLTISTGLIAKEICLIPVKFAVCSGKLEKTTPSIGLGKKVCFDKYPNYFTIKRAC